MTGAVEVALDLLSVLQILKSIFIIEEKYQLVKSCIKPHSF